jgi:hypothetical protein
MPPAKNARNPAKRSLSAAHKKALAEGRTTSATVDRYLAAINTPQRRGRKVSTTTLTARLADAQKRFSTATGLDKLVAAQDARSLKAKLAQSQRTQGVDLKSLETDFVKVAKRFSESRGVGYGAWRDAGVSAVVLKRAGIARTRG